MTTQTILAVDDEPHMLKLLERIIMEKTPYDLMTTHNALEVPDILERHSFDLLILDLKMPGLDGMDILRLVKEQERPEEVIIITAFGSLDSASDALSQGVFDYIIKPFKKEHIILTIEKAMRWQATKKEAARISSIFTMEPFQESVKAFEKEYICRLRDRYQGDMNVMTQRSGFSQDVLNSILQQDSGTL